MISKPRTLLAALTGWLASALSLDAQTAVVPAAKPISTATSDTVVLSPFEVTSERDDGYRASGTLAGTRLRTELRDVAASVSVYTKDFMQDIAANNLEDLLTYTTGTEVAGLGGNFSGASTSGTFTDFSGSTRSPQGGATRARGMDSPQQTRDYFITDAPMDSYNIDRVEVNRGPNAMLFGLGSAAGVINSGLIKAQPNRTKTKVEAQTDRQSSGRLVFDHNQVLIKDVLALRMASLLQDQRYQMKPAYINDKRLDVTGTWRPWKNTTVRVNSEIAKQVSNKPYTTTPIDQITWWWALGKPVYDPTTGIGRYLGTPPTDPNLQVFNATGGLTGSLIGSAAASLTLMAEDPNSSRLGITGLDPAIQAIETFNNRARLNTAGTAFANDGFRRLASAQTYLQQKNQAANPLLRNFWRSFRITDPNIYDFYDQMIEGPNKREWAFWKTRNLSLEQRLGRNAGIEVVYDWQKINAGYVQPLQFNSNAINVDITTNLPNGLPNPDLGRPFTNTALGFKNSNSSERETYRATAYYQLNFSELKTPWLAKLLGRHIFTGSFTDQSRDSFSFGGRLEQLGLDYQATKFANPADRILQLGQPQRTVERQSYLGPSLVNAASAANAGIQGVRAPQNLDGASTVTGLYYQTPNASPVALGPWKTGTFSIVQDGKYDFSNVTTGGNHNWEDTKSFVFVSNNYWWNDTLVSTLGWRNDAYKSKAAPSPTTDPVTGRAMIAPAVWRLQPGISQNVSKFNYGLVLHTPPFLRGKLPLGADVSLTYNKSDNFRPGRQTYDIFNNSLPPTTGTTEEWGTLVSLFNNKLELRVTKYKTAAQGATNGNFQEIQNLLERRLVSEMVAMRTPGYQDEVIAKGFSSALAAWSDFEKSPTAQILYDTFRIKTNPGSSIVDRDERIGEVVSTSDVLAEGYEFDLTYNPTPQWRMSLNAARQQTINGNTALPFMKMIALLAPVWGGTAGALPLGIGTNNNLQTDFNTTVNQAQAQVLLDGAPRPEVRRWRFNAVSNYSFRGGLLNGFRIGGAYRWQDKSAIGFPVRILADGTPIANVKEPYFGGTESNVDAWIGYSRKLSEKIRWSVQLNVKNIGKGNRLIAVSTQPDGSFDSPRIAASQTWSLTTAFDF